MGEMKIDTKPDVRPVNKRPYKLAHKYKEIVKKEIDNMLAAGIIYPIDRCGMGKSHGRPAKETRPDKVENLCRL